MVYEVCQQLRGEAGARQVKGASLGLIENGGGVMGFDEAACAVHILEKVAMSIDYRPEDPATLANPYPLFAQMRDEDPCHWSPRLKSWILTRYDDVKAVTQDGSMSSNRLQPFFASLPGDEARKIATSSATCRCGWCSRTRPSTRGCAG